MEFICLTIIFAISVLVLQIDLRRPVYAVVLWISLMMIFMVVYNYNKGLTTSILPLFFYIPIAIISVLLMCKSRQIIGYERVYSSKSNRICFLVLWIFLFFILIKREEKLFISILGSAMATVMLYFSIKSILKWYIFTWITYTFGREETFTGDITLTTVRRPKAASYYMKIQGIDKSFEINSKIKKEYLKDSHSCTLKQRTVVVKKSLIFKGDIILEMF